jgi:hypothetical protein
MKNKVIIAALFLLTASVLPAAADYLVTVTGTEGSLTASQQFTIPCTGMVSNWTLPSPVTLTNAHGVSLGTLDQLQLQSSPDPAVNVYFSVQANSSGETFDITTSTLSFPTLSPATAFATAAITLTSDTDGATIAGLFPGGKTYEARYNGSTVYADLVSGFTIGPNTSSTLSERDPLVAPGTNTIPSVSNITAEFDFTLTANEQASGTSRFDVEQGVPEPATMSLLVMGGMALLARRKKN